MKRSFDSSKPESTSTNNAGTFKLLSSNTNPSKIRKVEEPKLSPRSANFFNSVKTPVSVTQTTITEYVTNPEKFTCQIDLIHPVYLDDKRNFFPKPYVVLKGSGWRRKMEIMSDEAPEETTPPKSLLEVLFRIKPSNVETFYASKSLDVCGGQRNFPENFKIPNVNAIKVLVSINFHNFNRKCRQHVGVFHSPDVTVSSKPSAGITDGSTVSVFTRPTTMKNSSSLYFDADKSMFHCDKDKFNPLIIKMSHNTNHHAAEKTASKIYYGSTIQLVDTSSGKTLQELRIVPLNNSNRICTFNPYDMEPLGEYERIAFQMITNPTKYLCFHDKVYYGSVRDPVTLPQDAVWSVVSVAKTTWKFAEVTGAVKEDVSPVPKVVTMSLTAANSILRITGCDFNPKMEVWLGRHRLNAVSSSETNIVCSVDNIDMMIDIHRNLPNCAKDDGSVDIPLIIARDDGLVYPTEFILNAKSADGKCDLKIRQEHEFKV